jgi:3',5'-cyclic AMP phosphodiesterase CpdA
VYTFQYGPVRFIALNNNYWWTTDDRVEEYGGSPEGYILRDQLAWAERELRRAGRNGTVAHVVLFMQEPVFPAGGHVRDAMWHAGDNTVRAYARSPGEGLKPAGPGIVEVRNRLWLAVSRSHKVAAVLVGDEHAYHRMLVDNATPVGIPSRDDTDGDGVLERHSPNPEFRHPVWQICAGNAGAPWYAREPTPWEVERYVSRTGYLLFEATRDKLSMTAYALRGDAVMDRVHDLTAVKRREPRRD